jgi:hypothetical protein
MAITASDIEYRLSGGAANTSPAAALGGAMSTAGGGVITSAALNNLWDDVSGAEAAAGDIEYRCIYVKNAHGSLTWQSVVIWIDSLTSDADTEFDIGLDGRRLDGVQHLLRREHRPFAVGDLLAADVEGRRPLDRRHPRRIAQGHLDQAHRHRRRSRGLRHRLDPVRGRHQPVGPTPVAT